METIEEKDSRHSQEQVEFQWQTLSREHQILKDRGGQNSKGMRCCRTCPRQRLVERLGGTLSRPKEAAWATPSAAAPPSFEAAMLPISGAKQAKSWGAW